MARQHNGSPQGATIEGKIGAWVQDTRTVLQRRCEECEEEVRKSPSRSMLTAVGVGYLLRMLPLTAIIAALLHLVFALIRPAVLLFCAAKAYDLLQQPSENRPPAPRARAAG